MPIRYRNHLIIEKATLDQPTGFWNIRAHIQYNQHIEFRDVLITGPRERFKTRRAAENYIFTTAKQWVNNRLQAVDAGAIVKELNYWPKRWSVLALFKR